jgi:hypothetical protein
MKHGLWWDEDNGCARLDLVGEFTPEEATQAMSDIVEMLQGQGRRLLVVDHTHSPRAVSRETRAALEESAARVDHDKLAFFGMTNLNRIVARVIIAMIGKSSHTRFFKTEDEALAWIHEDP